MEKQSKFKICSNCHDEYDVGMFDLCGKCSRKNIFDALPDDQKRMAYRNLVHERYEMALMSHLSLRLTDKMLTLEKGKGVLLWGAPGVGKTYAMAALAKDYLHQGCTVARTSYEMLCLNIRDTFKSKATQTELDVIKPYLDADKLFIEDIGTAKSEGANESDFTTRVLLVLLDYRIERCLSVYVTTNRTVEELGRTFDERIASRLKQACEIIRLAGGDRRQGKQNAKSTKAAG